MVTTTTPATTPVTMATVWFSGSSVAETSNEEQRGALSVKANRTENRNIFFNPCLSPWFTPCSLMNVDFWSSVGPGSCMLYIALLSCSLGDLTPFFLLG